MFFTSYEFMAFLFVLLFLYYCVPKKCQWQLLLAASYLFYFMAGADYLIYILLTTSSTYFAAGMIGENRKKQDAYLSRYKAELSREERKVYKERQKRVRRRWLVACLLLNLGVLAVVKYANFAISGANDILRMAGGEGGISYLTLAIPLGISFYTFQAAGYLIDVYRGVFPAEQNPFRFALFVSFFPQLIQGPISRFHDLSRTLYEQRRFHGKTVCLGLQRILWGYFKKMVVADRILAGVSTITSDTAAYSGAYIFAGMIFYTVELYADFTGGIDITIGIAQTMGITVQENFIRPYFATSLKEYWRRWHISMCSWFRDYVFYPVSISGWMKTISRFFRKRVGEKMGKRIPVYLSSFLVWTATGIWHGASWNFVFWGISNWAVLMVSEELEPCYERFQTHFALKGNMPYKVFQVARTFLFVCVLNLFDCYASLADTFGMIVSMFTADNWHVLWDGSLLKLGLTQLDYAILALGVWILFLVSYSQRSGSVRDKIARLAYPLRFCVWYGLFLAVLLLGAYGIGYDKSQFIYNQF